jgi:hypothetical protein
LISGGLAERCADWQLPNQNAEGEN